MLITSRFRDYYDNIMSMGVDRDCVYVRKTKHIHELDEKAIRGILPFLSDNLGGYTFTTFLIGFVGKIYPVVRVEKPPVHRIEQIVKHLYNLEDYKDFLLTNKIKKREDKHFYRSGIDTESGLKRFFSKDYVKLEIFFVKYNVPIFSIEYDDKTFYSSKSDIPTYLVLNSKLKNFDFVRIKDPFSAFQEIFMFKAGVLGNPEKEIIIISDKDKAKQHGHDGKYSFKKSPKT